MSRTRIEPTAATVLLVATYSEALALGTTWARRRSLPDGRQVISCSGSRAGLDGLRVSNWTATDKARAHPHYAKWAATLDRSVRKNNPTREDTP